MKKTPLMQLIELRTGRTIESLMREGREQGLNWTEIAEQIGIPYATLNDWKQQLKAREFVTVQFASEEAAAAR